MTAKYRIEIELSLDEGAAPKSNRVGEGCLPATSWREKRWKMASNEK